MNIPWGHLFRLPSEDFHQGLSVYSRHDHETRRGVTETVPWEIFKSGFLQSHLERFEEIKATSDLTSGRYVAPVFAKGYGRFGLKNPKPTKTDWVPSFAKYLQNKPTVNRLDQPCFGRKVPTPRSCHSLTCSLFSLAYLVIMLRSFQFRIFMIISSGTSAINKRVQTVLRQSCHWKSPSFAFSTALSNGTRKL